MTNFISNIKTLDTDLNRKDIENMFSMSSMLNSKAFKTAITNKSLLAKIDRQMITVPDTLISTIEKLMSDDIQELFAMKVV